MVKKQLIRKILTFALCVQLIISATPKQADAMLIGLITLNVSVLMIGVGTLFTSPLFFGNGTAVSTIASLGLILDEPSSKPKVIDFKSLTPESLEVAYDSATSQTIWNELRSMDQELMDAKFKFQIPKAIQDFSKRSTGCNTACKQSLKAAENSFIRDVATTLERSMNERRPTNDRFKISTATVVYLVEQLSGYTFLSNTKALGERTE